jgi:hypothetical protein
MFCLDCYTSIAELEFRTAIQTFLKPILISAKRVRSYDLNIPSNAISYSIAYVTHAARTGLPFKAQFDQSRVPLFTPERTENTASHSFSDAPAIDLQDVALAQAMAESLRAAGSTPRSGTSPMCDRKHVHITRVRIFPQKSFSWTRTRLSE